MPDSDESTAARVEVGRYRKLAAARERGLVVSAKELPHWIEPAGREWVLLVEERDEEAVRRELQAFEVEQREPAEEREFLPPGKVPKLSLFVAGWVLAGFFFAQQIAPASWVESGVADGRAILAGQWWRTVTALTLHGDGPHLVANLASGLLFAAFLIPRLGSGLTWLAVLLSGAIGNALNAWGYRGESHLSLGASTACFGALGILVGVEFWMRWRKTHTRSLWQLILPIGAGLALLAFLGVGEERGRVDFMAHWWGFLAGVAEGMAMQAGGLRARLSERAQRVAAGLVLALIAGAWWCAST